MERWLARELARRDASLVGFWPLGVGLLDNSGRGHHATVNSTATETGQRVASRGGRRGAHVYQPTPSTTRTWLEVPSSADYSFDYSNPFTVSCWVWRDDDSNVSAPYPLLSKMDSAGNLGWEVLLTGTGAIQAKLFNLAQFTWGLQVTSEAAASQTGRWHHIVVTYDGSRAATGFHVYLNGLPLTLTVDANNPQSSAVGTDVLKMGARMTGASANGNLQGLLLLARIYNRQLSAREALQLHRREAQAEWYSPKTHWSNTSKQSLALYLAAYDSQSASQPLYISGVMDTSDAGGPYWRLLLMQLPELVDGYNIVKLSDSMSLFVEGVGASNDSLPLYIGSAASATPTALPLTLVTDDIPIVSGDLSLFVAGNNFAGNGAEGLATLFVSSDALERTLPLFLKGSDNDGSARNVNLWVDGQAHQANSMLDLFLLNEQSGVDTTLSMYVAGDGINAGWNPHSTDMNLVLVRDPANAVTLYTQGPGAVSESGVDLFIDGYTVFTGDLDLSIPEVLGFATDDAKLYTCGW